MRTVAAGALVLMGLLALTVSPAAAQPFKDTGTYKISKVFDARSRSAIVATGADILEAGHDYVLVEASDYIGYYSGDNTTAANRPRLVVTYQ
jgi:hypothetical protein